MAQKWSGEPEIVTLPDVTVATVHTSGNPEGLGADVMKALYGAVYGLKFALKSGGTDDRTPRSSSSLPTGTTSRGCTRSGTCRNRARRCRRPWSCTPSGAS